MSFTIDGLSKTGDAMIVPPTPSLRSKMNDGSSHPFRQPIRRANPSPAA